MLFKFCLSYSVLIWLLWVSVGFAQNKKYSVYTVNDGLPSNNVYRVVEDNKGFLWVATNAGVARFDGKYFQVFTTREGLPDNEVLSVVKETDGRVWIQCFNQMPAYFDEVQNRFIIPVIDKKTAIELANTLDINLHTLPKGGISYTNKDRWIVFKDAKLKKYGSVAEKIPAANIIEEYPDGSILVISGGRKQQVKVKDKYQITLYHIQDEKILDSINLIQDITGVHSTNAGGIRPDNGNLYFGLRYFKKFYVYTDIQTNPIRWKTNSVQVKESYLNYFLTPDRLAFITESGKILTYNKHTLQPIHAIENEYLTNSYFNDHKGNEWISTIDKGLVVYRNQSLQSLEMPEQFFNTNFISITRKDDGTLLAGNYYGEVIEIKNGKSVVHKVINKSPARIRKILTLSDYVYTFSEEGIYQNFKTRIPITTQDLSFGKTAVVCNDSTILISANSRLVRLDPRTNKIYDLNSRYLRITTLAKVDDEWIYFGSTNGLYKYNYKTNSDYISLANTNPALGKRVSGICYTHDGLLWITQSDNTIFVLNNDKIILKINLNNIFSNNSNKHIAAGKPGHVWVSTSGGINVIHYRWKENKLVYTTRNISAKDGLASNEVEEIFYQDGKMYVSTNNGITIVPEDYTAPKTDIPTYLIQMSVNQRDTIISDNYHLKYNQRDIQMYFAGVDLNGYFGFLQYRLDDEKQWAKLPGNTLNIQLRTGEHTLKVRAVDVNGNISHKILTLKFDVAVPFWLNIWFWIGLGVLVQVIIFYAISRYQKRKKEAKLARKIAGVQSAAIEQQAFTSLMNPHFMFNALNSIQHYINLQDRKNANRYLSDFASLIRKNFEAAQQSFITLEEEIENIKIYLNLERMRFNDRFQFKIEIEDSLEIDDWMVPTMILQPLLENALLHGIMPSTIPGKISIRFVQKEEDLLIEITDNGIGVVNSLALKGFITHKSRGMELINKRIIALSHFGIKPITITTGPIFESETNPGNKVTLLIPNTLHDSWRTAQI